MSEYEKWLFTANSIPQLRAIMLHASTFARAGTALRVRH